MDPEKSSRSHGTGNLKNEFSGVYFGGITSQNWVSDFIIQSGEDDEGIVLVIFKALQDDSMPSSPQYP